MLGASSCRDTMASTEASLRGFLDQIRAPDDSEEQQAAFVALKEVRSGAWARGVVVCAQHKQVLTRACQKPHPVLVADSLFAAPSVVLHASVPPAASLPASDLFRADPRQPAG